MIRRLRAWGRGSGGRHLHLAPEEGPPRSQALVGTSVGVGGRDTALSDLPFHSGNHLLLSFQVSKKYSDIEEFYQKLSSRYPTASLPPLPRKVLFVGEGDIRERRALFDEILRCVSKDAELAGSPELLEFLGT